MTPPPSPTARRIATPSWLDLRLVVGVVLVLASVLLGATIVSRASATHATVAAKRDLAAGTILRAGDLETRQVQLPGNVKGVYLYDLHAAVGRTLDRPVAEGELLPSAAVHHASARTTVTVPFASDAAPELHDGQRIEVWVSTATCASVVLLPDVTVQSVRRDDSGSFRNGADGQDVVISVDPAEANRVVGALAIDGAQIRAGVLTGGAASPAPTSAAPSTSAPAPTPSGVPPASATGAGLPADLAACGNPSAGR